MNWTKKENDILLDAIDEGVTPQHVVEIVVSKTSRSEKSVVKRLRNVGYLRACGRCFRSKQGFVRK